MVKKVIVLGGGSAGFMAAVALKSKAPALDVLVIRSADIGIIGVGEGSTITLTKFLHEYLQVGMKRFHEVAQPTWKLGLKFVWGRRPHFYYGFGPGMDARYDDLPKAKGYYCDDCVEYADTHSALMAHDKAFERLPGTSGGVKFHDAFSYHFENEKYVHFLEGYALAKGVRTLDDTVLQVEQDDAGVSALRLRSGSTETADLYVDASGFSSLLLGKTLAEPFVSFKNSLFCDRAVVGGWDRAPDEPIHPYTTCETMPSGWAWQIEHETRVHRGYVYASDFVSDADAERDFRALAPKVAHTRVVRFASGRYDRAWVKNVVAIGNASGFVEPLEATALGVIAMQSRLVADTLLDSDFDPTPTEIRGYNDFHRTNWDSIRGFIATHYRFNDRLDTPFWQACRADADLARAAPVVDYYRENGPSNLWEHRLFDPADQFRMSGYSALLIGMRVPYRHTHTPAESELRTWNSRRNRLRESALRGVGVKEGLDLIRSPKWKWA